MKNAASILLLSLIVSIAQADAATTKAQPNASAHSSAHKTAQTKGKPSSSKSGSQQKTVTGWTLKQHSQYQGLCTLYLSDLGTRYESHAFGLLVNPKAELLIFNDEAQTFCKLTREELEKRYTSKVFSSGIKKGKTGTIAGIKAQQYVSEDRKKNGELVHTTEWWATKGFNVPTKIADGLSKVINIPPGYGLPIKVVRTFARDKRKAVMLDTLSCRRGEIPVTAFASPTGYKQLKSPVQIFTPDEDAMMLLDETSDLDGIEPTKQQKLRLPKSLKER